VRRDELCLVDHAAADGSGVDLDETDDVGILLGDEIGDPFEDMAAAPQVSGARTGRWNAGPVPVA
jgi:hypothetical protein